MKGIAYIAIVVVILAAEVMCAVDCHRKGGVFLGRDGVCVRAGSILR